MSNSSKIAIFAIIAVVVLIGIKYGGEYSSRSSKDNNSTEQSSTVPVENNSVAVTLVEDDLSSIDLDLGTLDADIASVDQGLNDKSIPQAE